MPHDKDRQPFVGSGRAIEGGALATRKQDFNAHIQGNGFRHAAVDLDMHPALTQILGSLSDPTVQGTLEKIGDFLDCIGQGFVTIGDGYGAECGTEITIGDPGIPDLETAFTTAFANDRLRNGGIVMVKAGEYVLTTTVTIPAGISIMGEIAGTTIVGETPELPLFRISRSLLRPSISLGADTSKDPTDKSTFFNLTLADNINSNVASGGPSLSLTPMILCERGSHFSCDQVTFLGRMGTLGAGPNFGRPKTLRAIGYTTGSSEETTLVVENCTFDAMRTAIDFSPGGSADHLVVNKCKARTFGTEDATSTAAQNNCFVTINSGNARLTNNFYVAGTNGSADFVVNCFVSTGTAGDFIITGNIGSASPTGGATVGDIIAFTGAGTKFATIISGNRWDERNINNEWFFTVGDGASSIGDITGSGALEEAMDFLANTNMGATVIVNPGTYVVASVDSENLNLIGNKRGNEYPLIQVNTTGTTWNLGSVAKSLHFQSTGAAIDAIKFNFKADSAAAADQGGTIEIDDCLFTDVFVQLAVPNESAVDPTNSKAMRSHQVVRNCQFLQTGDAAFVDTLSLWVRGNASTVRIEDSIFEGNGYALAIAASNIVNSEIFINNCIMDMTGSTVTGASPTGTNTYVDIDTNNARVTISDSRIVVANDLTSRTAAIAAGLSTTFTRFAAVSAREVNIENTLVVGPHQTFDSGGTLFAMPAMRLEGKQNIFVDNSRFIGALPMQITGADLLDSDEKLKGITISNSQFKSAENAADLTLTTLDIDFDFEALLTTFSQVPKIDIINNIFDQRLTTSSRPVLHENNDVANASYYITQGVVQIFAGLTDINFSNNKVLGNLRPFGAVDGSDPLNPYTNFAGVHIDGYSLDNFSGSTGLGGNAIHIHNNSLSILNDFDSTTPTDVISALSVVANISKITNNNLILVNNGIANIGLLGALSPQNTACSLVVFNAPTTSTAFADSVITGNTFSRRDAFGIPFPHKIATVIVVAGSGQGICVDNAFSDVDVDGLVGSLSVQFLGPLPPFAGASPWVFERNRNQIVLEEITSLSGRFLMERPGGLFRTDLVTGVDPTTDNRIQSKNGAFPADDTNFVFERGNGFHRLQWFVPLNERLPPNVEITSVAITNNDNTFNGSGTATANAVLQIVDKLGGISSSVVDLTVTASGFTLVPIIPRFRFYTTATLNTTLFLEASSSETGVGTDNVQFSSVLLFYRY